MRLAPQELRTFFITLACANRRRVFQVHATAELFVTHLQEQRKNQRIALHAYVVMPDHVHLLLTPAHNIPLEKCIQFLKGGFSFLLASRLEIWQRGYFEKRVPDAAAYAACVRYIDENPVKAGLCETPECYGFGSAARRDIDPIPAWFRTQGHQG